MNPEQNRPSRPACPDPYGALPSCAPLAVPFVPFQRNQPDLYGQEEALSNGTLFPGLNLPFHLKVDAAMVGNAPLAELQALEFVIQELALYLDTHCDDKEAFTLFQKYAALAKEGRKRYEEMYGPITLKGTANSECYTWLNDPWPWEMPKGGSK